MALSTANLLARQLRSGTTTKFGAFARGGLMRPGQVGLVGEQGPELVLGREPTTIIPSHLTSQVLGGRAGISGNQAPTGGQAPGMVSPASPAPTGVGSALAQRMTGGSAMRTGADMMSTADRFYQAGFTLPAGLVDQPSIDAYMKAKLMSMVDNDSIQDRQKVAMNQAYWLERNMSNPNYNGPDAAGIAALRASGVPIDINQFHNRPGVAPSGPQTPGVPGQGGPGGSPFGGGLPPSPFGPGASPMGGIDPKLLQALQQGLTGQNAPQAPQAPAFDPELMQLIRDRAMGIGTGPSFEDIIQGTFNPMSDLLDEQFQTAQTQAFEQMVSRGVLQSGETFNAISEMSREFGMTKAALVGQLALEYSQQRQQQISDAINQWGVLEGQRASNQTTLTAANIQAATQIMATSMQTLATLNSAMAQIASTERIAGADIMSREKIAGMQIGSAEKIAGMDIQSRQAIAEMQASVQRDVANISAQAMLQAANFDYDIATQQLNQNMLMEGIDWERFNSDPAYHQEIVMEMGLRADTAWAMAQAAAAGNITDPLLNGRA